MDACRNVAPKSKLRLPVSQGKSAGSHQFLKETRVSSMKKLLLIMIAAVAVAIIPAHAGIYSQALNLNGDGGYYSYPSQQIADAFQLSVGASLVSLDWYGDNFANAFTAAVAFTINLYNDAGGLPEIGRAHV